MSRTPIWPVLILVSLFAASCSPAPAAAPRPPAAEPAATAAPAAAAAPSPAVVEKVVKETVVVEKEIARVVITTPTRGAPVGSTPVDDPRWARIRAAGQLVVGASSGSKPFAYYGTGAGLDGFDPALAAEIGRRLGLRAVTVDFAPEGMAGALQAGQIDMALASLAASLTDTSVVMGTRPYFTSNLAVLAREGGGPGTVRAPGDLAGRTIGVQQGTLFETWVRDELVAPGRIAAADLLLYRDVEQAAADLAAGRTDAVVLDGMQARSLAGGGLIIAGERLDPSVRSAAVAAGSTRLRDEIDRALAGMEQDGALARLASQYLGPVDFLPFPAPGAPEPSRSPVAPAGCLPGMAKVANLTSPGEAPLALQPGQRFAVTFRLRNTGSCAWGSDFALAYALGSSPAAPMGVQGIPLRAAVAPGAESEVTFSLVAPAAAGSYLGVWEMRDARGAAFGERIAVRVAVQEPPAPAPSAVPTLPPGSFTADHTRIKPGECVTLAWNIRDIQAIYFYTAGEPWEQHPAVGQETRRLCPGATTTYELRLIQLNGSAEVRPVTIVVDAGAEVALQVALVTAPESQVRAGECVNLSWEVQGRAERVRVMRDDAMLWDSAPQLGNLRDCPAGTGTILYAVIAANTSETVQTQRALKIVQ